MMYVRFPLSLRNLEDLLFERGIDTCHETVRYWWNRWHLDEMYVKLNGEMVYLWRAVDQEDEILESFITKTRLAASISATHASPCKPTPGWRLKRRHCARFGHRT